MLYEVKSARTSTVVSLQLNGQVCTLSTSVHSGTLCSHTPTPPRHLEDRNHIRMGVEQHGGESGVGAWPG